MLTESWDGLSMPSSPTQGRILCWLKFAGSSLAKKYLLPMAGGVHARRASDYIASVVRQKGGELTICSVVTPDAQQGSFR